MTPRYEIISSVVAGLVLVAADPAGAVAEDWTFSKVRDAVLAERPDYGRLLDGATVQLQVEYQVREGDTSSDGGYRVETAVRESREPFAGSAREVVTYPEDDPGPSEAAASGRLLTPTLWARLLRYAGSDVYVITQQRPVPTGEINKGFIGMLGKPFLRAPASAFDADIEAILTADGVRPGRVRSEPGPDGEEVRVEFDADELLDGVWYRSGSVTLLPELGWAVRRYDVSTSSRGAGTGMRRTGEATYGTRRAGGLPVPERLVLSETELHADPARNETTRREFALTSLSLVSPPDDTFTMDSFPIAGRTPPGWGPLDWALLAAAVAALVGGYLWWRAAR